MKFDMDNERDRELLKRYNAPLLIKKAVQEMQGIAAAVIYDGKVDDKEIELLNLWISVHSNEVSQWPLTELWEILEEITNNGSVSDTGRQILFEFLCKFAAGPKQPNVIEGIFTEGKEVIFKNRIFAFTGKLEFGSRRKAQNAVIERGGLISANDSVTGRTNYLVVGNIGNEMWKYSRFGNKIEKALQLKELYGTICIIKERSFVSAVVTSSPE
jgi:NAD-dependent DNA ligase